MRKDFLIVTFLILVLSACVKNAKHGLSPKEVFVEGNSKGIMNFYIFQYELTVNEYKQYLELSGDEYDFEEWKYYDGPLNKRIESGESPMMNVTFMETIKFANWLSTQHKLKPAYKIEVDGEIKWNQKANGYRVALSEEWEWAARGGVKSKGYKYPGSDNLDEVAWHDVNRNDIASKLKPVGMKQPNELGIYDMFGSVAEWCWDQYLYLDSKIKPDVEGAYEHGSGTWSIPFKREKQQVIPFEKLERITRGMYANADDEWFVYGKEISIDTEYLGEDIGIRLIRNAK